VAHADRLRHTHLDGPADLGVEIVSPDSIERDRGEKFVEYEAAGIPEYWLVDPLRAEALFYRLGQDGRYHRGPIDADGWYRSTVLAGFRLQVAWLWQEPLPSVEDVVAQTAG
jgi:Uma2 family endonuclease